MPVVSGDCMAAGKSSSVTKCSPTNQSSTGKRKLESSSAGSTQAKPQNAEDHTKTSKKRAKPGESTRSKPKDRQQILNRMKDLRGMIPNGGKLTGKENSVYLKDHNSRSGGNNTWALAIEGQKVVCLVLVEDLSTPGQMLIEILCEERGFFLELADEIRDFELNILKGVMESREDKI